MHEVPNEEVLLSLLQSAFQTALRGIIGIDGRDGVGKTTLAHALATATGGTVVSLDNFLRKTEEDYVSQLTQTDLRVALSVHQRPIIIEGVCLLAALESVREKPNLLIYVKRLMFGWYWHDEEILNTQENVDILIERLSPITPLKEEIIRYHSQYKPLRQADIVYGQVAIK